jgi:hypothetical protein
LSPDAVTKLRDALTQWVDGAGNHDALLRDALHTVARDARERGIRAEELLVTLKSTWFEVVDATDSAHETSNHKRLDELVTACIKAYYG